MERKILYIVNPISGGKNKDKIISIIKSKTQLAKINFEIIFSVADGNYEEVKNKIQVENYTDVVIAGGDGTVSAVIAALRNLPINFGILPLGSGNSLAYASGISKNIANGLNIIFQNKSTFIDAMSVNDKFACIVCGFGFDGKIAEAFDGNKRRGLLMYILLTLKYFFRHKSFDMEWSANGKIFHTKNFVLSVCNSNQYGNNFVIAPSASLSDGKLDILQVNYTSKLKILFSLMWHLLSGKTLLPALKFNSSINYFQTENIKVKIHQSIPAHIDGEPVKLENEVEIKIIKNCFRLLIP